MSTEEGSRSLSSGLSIPQWMKNKITDRRFDLDESTFSPPENDDSFLYIPYPQGVARKLKSPTPIRKNSLNNVTTLPPTEPKLEADYINHTDPCKQFISQPGYRPYSSVVSSAEIKKKSNGTDDGFKGEGAACGTSVIRVAHQMVAGKYINNCAAVEADPLKPSNFDSAKRRGSKSLPVSPISSPPGSPMSRRRLLNKYFTGPFVDNENHGSGWILHSLLSKRDISQSVGLIPEEGIKGDLGKAISDLHINEPPIKEKKYEKKIKRDFGPKPSEFRELNFWSPTSM